MAAQLTMCKTASTDSAPGGQGGGLSEAQRIADQNLPAVTRRLVEFALAPKPPRNVAAAITAARELIALAQGALSGSGQDADRAVRVVLVDSTQLGAELSRRKG